ncbi:hypothetical protein RSJ42_17860 [Methanosarcina hadiensis]
MRQPTGARSESFLAAGSEGSILQEFNGEAILINAENAGKRIVNT